MIRRFMILCAILIAFTGCSDSSIEREGGRTQEIVQESSVQASSTPDRLVVSDDTGAQSVSSAESSQTSSAKEEISSMTQDFSVSSSQAQTSSMAASSASPAVDTNNLFAVRAEKEALEIDLKMLESRYRIGEIDDSSFRQEKDRLIQQKDTYDRLEDELERSQTYTFTLPETIDGKIQRLDEVEKELEILEEEMDKAEDDYFMGKYTREEFVSLRTEQEQREDTLDEEEDWLDDYLDDWD